MDISAEAVVHCTDGVAGRVKLIIINPLTDRISHVVVRERSFPHVKRLVPIGLVERASSQEIRLACSRNALSRMRSLVETEFVVPTSPDQRNAGAPHLLLPYIASQPAEPRSETMLASKLSVRRGTVVKATDGVVGTVGLLAVEPVGGEITDLVVRAAHPRLGRAEVTIPVSKIDRVEEHAVHLKLDRATVRSLPAVPAKHGQPRDGPKAGARRISDEH
jgi:hypothetical protein